MEFNLNTLNEAERTLIPNSFNLLKLAYEMHHRQKKDLFGYVPIEEFTLDISCVSFEGVNCSGKSTQLKKALVNRVSSKIQLFPKRENIIPYQILKEAILSKGSKDYDPITWSLIFSSLYLQRFENLDRTNIYLFDRGIDTSFVLQTSKLEKLGFSTHDSLKWLISLVDPKHLYADIFYLDIDLEEAIKRDNERASKEKRYENLSERKKDFEDQLRIYFVLNKDFNRNYSIINGKEPIDKITKKIQDRLGQISNSC